jgi:hypothetical protein
MTHSSKVDAHTAAFLTFLIPGWGHLRRGQIKSGLIWMVVVLVGYFLMILPGLILHIICMIDVYLRK